MSEFTFRIFRGTKEQGKYEDYKIPVDTGMVVLDCVHQIQQKHASDLAVRWNCKAGKCGSCSAEIDGKPRLMCMTRMETFEPGATITLAPLRTFPIIKDLVTDVSWNYGVNQRIKPLKTSKPEADGAHRMSQIEVDRAQEFRKCIECFLCQDVCHVLRNQGKHADFAGPRFFVRLASLEMHPLDTEDRIPETKEEFGVGYCNITRCCTDVCPEGIKITDNAIIPLKERVVDRYFDPLAKLFGMSKTDKPEAGK